MRESKNKISDSMEDMIENIKLEDLDDSHCKIYP